MSCWCRWVCRQTGHQNCDKLVDRELQASSQTVSYADGYVICTAPSTIPSPLHRYVFCGLVFFVLVLVSAFTGRQEKQYFLSTHFKNHLHVLILSIRSHGSSCAWNHQASYLLRESNSRSLSIYEPSSETWTFLQSSWYRAIPNGCLHWIYHSTAIPQTVSRTSSM